MQDPQPPREEPPRRAMPRPAIKAIAASGLFCALMMAFLAFFAWRMDFGLLPVVVNAATCVFMLAGSVWMLAQLKA